MCRKGFFLIVLMVSFTFSFGQKYTKSPAKSTPYVMHRVKFGETLTKIAKQYGVKVTDILKNNPSQTENSILPEQIIRIPNSQNKKLITDLKTEVNDLKPNPEDKPKLQAREVKLHTVEKGQTLYAISKLYQVGTEDIKKWNKLTDNNVKIGTQLIVSDPEQKKKATADLPKTPITVSEPVKRQPVAPPTAAVSETTDEIAAAGEEELEKPDVQASNNESQKELAATFKKTAATVSSRGTGAPMTTTLGAMENVYFAMHKTLPIGTVIKIKNLVNSKIVYAKVIGKLPETDENKHVIVRYSLGVKKDLQLQNGKCYVQITYPD